MKHINLLAATLIFASLANAQQKAESYVVEGLLPDSALQGRMIYIERYDDGVKLDSAKVQNGRFTFKGKTNAPYFCRIDADRKYGNLILEGGKISIDVTGSHTAVGTPLNNLFNQYETDTEQLHNQLQEKLAQIRESDADTREKQQQMQKLYKEKYQPLLMQKRLDLYRQHTNDPIGEIIIRALSMEATPDEMDQVFAQAGPWLQSLKSTQKIKKQFEALRVTQPGKMFVDLEGKDENNQPLKLSDFVGKGKYTLVDFWASWCGPCREETPTIAKAYERFKDKGLQVIGVATWDKPEHTKKAIKELNITWPQIFDTGMQPMELYGFNGIPQIMLFGPDGTIIARDLRGEGIAAKIEESKL